MTDHNRQLKLTNYSRARMKIKEPLLNWTFLNQKQGSMVQDNLAEWLRRQPAKLLGLSREGSNPSVVVFIFNLIKKIIKSKKRQKMKFHI